jgi:hypothetical protein
MDPNGTEIPETEFLRKAHEITVVSREAERRYADSEILWAIWYEGERLHARVIRGRDLQPEPNNVQAVIGVENEDEAYDAQETYGDPMVVGEDGKTWQEVMPPVPPQFRAFLEEALLEEAAHA